MLEVCEDKIRSEIKQVKFLSVISSDTAGVPEHTQLLVFFCYELEGAVYEKFWGFFNPKNSKC